MEDRIRSGNSKGHNHRRQEETPEKIRVETGEESAQVERKRNLTDKQQKGPQPKKNPKVENCKET
jgi:hypothetical protein